LYLTASSHEDNMFGNNITHTHYSFEMSPYNVRGLIYETVWILIVRSDPTRGNTRHTQLRCPWRM